MLGIQITFVQGFGAPNFHIWHWNLGKWIQNLSLEGFWEGYKGTYDVSLQSAIFDNLSSSIGQIWTRPMEVYALKLTMSFQQQLAHPKVETPMTDNLSISS